MYKIGDLSRCVSLPVKTLRYWSEIGLLVPDEIDRFTGYRYYSTAKLGECGRILAMKELGFSLDEIRAFSDDKRAGIIDAKTAELEGLVKSAKAKLIRLAELKNELEEGKHMFDIITRVPTHADRIKAVTTRRVFADRDEALAEIGKLKSSLPERSVGARELIISFETDGRGFDLDLMVGVESDRGETLDLGKETGTVMSVVTRENEREGAYAALMKRIASDHLMVAGAFCELLYGGGVIEIRVPVSELVPAPLVSYNPSEGFVDDPDVVGKWKLLDCVPTKEHFVCGRQKTPHDFWLDELYFLPGGAGYWVHAGWTKGTLYEHTRDGVIAEGYVIEEKDGRTLMFRDVFECDEKGRPAGKPYVWVYEKLDNLPRTADEIGISDRLDYPFEDDDAVHGSWKSVGFARDAAAKENFVPGTNTRELFVTGISFSEGGECVYETKNRKWKERFTKGLILSDVSRTASAYEIKEIDGREYLFVEWKSGDYRFAGLIRYYVFVRQGATLHSDVRVSLC